MARVMFTTAPLARLIRDVRIEPAARGTHDRGEVHDCSALLLEHVACGRARAQEHGSLVDGDHGVPFGLGQLGRGLADRGARIVDEDVDAAQTRRQIVVEAVNLGFERDVERVCFGIAHRGGSLPRLVEVAIDQNGACVGRHEGFRGRPPDAARAAGDDRHLAVEAEAVERG
jgi:hypothetical protein